MSARSFRDSLRNFVPAWLSDRPGFSTGVQILYVLAGYFDDAMEAAIEGTRAGWPGSDNRTDNLDLIGASRLIFKGETETTAHYVPRARAWNTTLRDMGGDVGLATQLHEWIANNPKIRLISRNGLFTTVDTDGTVTQVQGSWDWDSVSNPERSAMWWDYWIVVYPITAGDYYVKDTGTWGDGLEGPPVDNPQDADLGWGHNCTRVESDVIVGIVKQWRGGHINVRCMIWSYGTDYYAPSPVSGSPDGTWGKWYNPNTLEPSRNQTDRFWSLGTEIT